MYRGTTPKLTFNVGFDVSYMNVLWITFKQGSKIKFEKQLEDCIIKPDTKQIIVNLSQTETLSLVANLDLNIQLRVGFSNGKRAASKTLTTYVDEILHDGEI